MVKNQKKELESPITKDMMIADMAQSHPEAAIVLMEKGMHCIGCGASAFETIEEGLQAHGIPDDEIDTIIDEMNKFIKDNSKNSKSQ
jgi:hybrid cluster-associated redox disulfide protein